MVAIDGVTLAESAQYQAARRRGTNARSGRSMIDRMQRQTGMAGPPWAGSHGLIGTFEGQSHFRGVGE